MDCKIKNNENKVVPRKMNVQCVYDLFSKYMLKSTLIELDNNFNEFMKQDSILIDDVNLKLIGLNNVSKIKTVIDEYSSVFIKLNNSAPTDSLYMVSELKCF